ncbi:Uncharacterised protein [Mycobacterium tuberculosis]|nr:Uncharacterised protein [Mycobacterium tuberculosis]CNM79696.1 Uncharacterised protein [Mycobacterium tuberculosis]
MAIGATVTLHTHRADIGQQHHRTLPDLVVQARRGQLLTHDRIGVPQRIHPLGGDLPDDPNTQPRSRKRLARHDLLRQTQLPPDRAHLVFEQQPQRLNEGELQVVGQAADIVVALDVRGAAAPAGLHHIRIQRALHQELSSLTVQHIPHRALERADELTADDLAFALGGAHARQRLEEGLGRVDGDQVGAGGGHEIALHLRPLTGAQQPVVDEDTGQPVADGPLHQGRGHRGIHAAG